MVVTPVVVGIQWRFLLNAQFGVLNWILDTLGLPIGGVWLTTPFGAMFWVIVVDIWYYTPVVSSSTAPDSSRFRRRCGTPPWWTG